MEYASVIGWTAAKIGLVMIVILTFAPVLIWAERRQSAMIQDRIGPHRAGIPSIFFKRISQGAVLVTFIVWVIVAAMWYVRSLPEITSGAFVSPDNPLVSGTKELIWWLLVAGAVGTPLIAIATGGLAFLYKGRDVTLIGLLHPLADAVKMIFKEDFVPAKADRLLFALAPIITLIPAVLAFAVIPFSDTLYLDVALETLPYGGAPTPDMMQSAVPIQVASLDIGILFIFAVAGTGVVGAAIGGYASDNKYSLMGGIRAAGQMVSYEVALGLTLVPCFMYYGTLRLDEIVSTQANETFLGFLPAWSIFHPIMWLPFILYVTASIAESKRIPFDLPEGESELVGGYFTEYSGMKFGMFFFAEFIEVIALAALAAAIFFGGWDTPFVEQSGIVLPGVWETEVWGITLSHRLDLPHFVVVLIQLGCFILKIAILIFMQLQIRWTLPRFRYDQIMSLCWKILLPLALLNVFLTGAFILWNPF